MKLEQVRAIAKSHSVKPGNLSKAELIRSIHFSVAKKPAGGFSLFYQ